MDPLRPNLSSRFVFNGMAVFIACSFLLGLGLLGGLISVAVHFLSKVW